MVLNPGKVISAACTGTYINKRWKWQRSKTGSEKSASVNPIYMYTVSKPFAGEQDHTDKHRVLTLFPENIRENVICPISSSLPTSSQTYYALTHCFSSGQRKTWVRTTAVSICSNAYSHTPLLANMFQ